MTSERPKESTRAAQAEERTLPCLAGTTSTKPSPPYLSRSGLGFLAGFRPLATSFERYVECLAESILKRLERILARQLSSELLRNLSPSNRQRMPQHSPAKHC